MNNICKRRDYKYDSSQMSENFHIIQQQRKESSIDTSKVTPTTEITLLGNFFVKQIFSKNPKFVFLFFKSISTLDVEEQMPLTHAQTATITEFKKFNMMNEKNLASFFYMLFILSIVLICARIKLIDIYDESRIVEDSIRYNFYIKLKFL